MLRHVIMNVLMIFPFSACASNCDTCASVGTCNTDGCTPPYIYNKSPSGSNFCVAQGTAGKYHCIFLYDLYDKIYYFILGFFNLAKAEAYIIGYMLFI